eukprot:4438614-Pleurochrysis_carterae.AAC.1
MRAGAEIRENVYGDRVQQVLCMHLPGRCDGAGALVAWAAQHSVQLTLWTRFSQRRRGEAAAQARSHA